MSGVTYGIVFIKQTTAYEIRISLVGSEMCIWDGAHTGQKHRFRFISFFGSNLLFNQIGCAFSNS